MTAISATVVIVAYRSGELLERALEGVLATRYRPFNVVLVDNGGNAEAIARIQRRRDARVTLLEAGKNLGFAGGVTRAIEWRERRGGSLVYALVNPDCVVEPGWLGPLVTVLACDPSVAVVGGLLIDAGTGRVQHAGGVVRPNGLTEHAGRGIAPARLPLRPAEVDYVTGAMCAFRAETWKRLGGFDCGYFPAYFEEVDFCSRARQLGLRVVFEPAARGIHFEASASGGPHARAYHDAYHRSRIRFAARHLLVRGRWRAAVAAELGWLAKGGARGTAASVARAYLRLPLELAARRKSSSMAAAGRGPS
ncbi:MAG: glycosyltransferase family 2 protein [Candidatus Dadabacteria bacterium]|nr:MAG: glycosyltransferase family 2 protein [Candidatus Dadabacteria bacterium]